MTDLRNVFVVEGRNLVANRAISDFLRAVDLHPLEWPELVAGTGSGAPVVDQVLDTGLEDRQAVVVVFTPDDEATLREQYRQPDDPDYETTLAGQPRPNVLLETGRALALYRERTIIVQFGEIRPISDLAGMHVLRASDSSEFRHELANRLKTAGCAANTAGNQWLSAGDFASALSGTSLPARDSQQGIAIGKKVLDSAPALVEDQAGGQPDKEPLGVSLSQDSLELLTEAYAGKPGAYITRVRMGGRLRIKTAGRTYVEADVSDPEAKRWYKAIEALFDEGLVENNKSDTFYLTPQGSTFLEAMVKQ